MESSSGSEDSGNEGGQEGPRLMEAAKASKPSHSFKSRDEDQENRLTAQEYKKKVLLSLLQNFGCAMFDGQV